MTNVITFSRQCWVLGPATECSLAPNRTAARLLCCRRSRKASVGRCGVPFFHHYSIERRRKLFHVRENRLSGRRYGSLDVAEQVAGDLRCIARLAASLLAAALPLACAAPRPAPPSRVANPFLGTWETAEHASITFRPDTVLQNPPAGPPQAFGEDTCGGVFRFRYTSKSREALAALIPRQPDVQGELSQLLPQPRY
ncbi:MAG TPA: hypothetical protein VE993_13770, partial [Stellaceae bacterium]|nr:hypothetical protein [Stellaceae bacterium]